MVAMLNFYRSWHQEDILYDGVFSLDHRTERSCLGWIIVLKKTQWAK